MWLLILDHELKRGTELSKILRHAMRAYAEDLNSLQYVDFGDISSSFDQF